MESGNTRTQPFKRSVMLASTLAVGMTLAAGQSSAAGVNLVINGDFEDTTTLDPTGLQNSTRLSDLATSTGANWDVYTAIAGWTTSDGTGIEVQTSDTLSNIDAQSEEHYVELDSHQSGSNSTMVQDINLAAGVYELSFWYSPRVDGENTDTNGINYGLGGDFSNVAGPNAGPPATVVGQWTEISQQFTVAGGTHTLAFGATGQEETLGGLIDNVALRAVPIPAAAWLFGSAILGLAGLKRRRNRA